MVVQQAFLRPGLDAVDSAAAFQAAITRHIKYSLARERDELTAARDAVTATVGEGWIELHDLLHQLDTALRQVAQVGTPGQRAAASALLVSTRRQLYRILAEDADDAVPPAPEKPQHDERR